MSVFRSDDGREIDEADLRLVVELADCPSHSYGGVGEATTRVLAALVPMPRKLTGAELAVAHGIVDGPDGEDWLQAQLRAPDVLERIEEEGYVVLSRQMVDGLEREAGLDPDNGGVAAPKTCGAVLNIGRFGTPPMPLVFECVLPPGHHPVVYDHNIEAPRCTCGRDLLHENHAPGHMPSADSWVVPND